jgi:formylmethanofuran dehydrogenase subunit E
MKINLDFVEHLRGTCMSLQEGLNNFDILEEDLEDEDYELLDENIMRCDGCGWWVESHEIDNSSGDAFCKDCVEEEDEDEDE